MTDKERLINLLTDFGVEFEDDNDGYIDCRKGAKKVSGYDNFYTEFSFNEDGSFIEMGAFE